MKTLITIDSSEEKQAYYKNTDLFYKKYNTIDYRIDLLNVYKTDE